MFPNQHPKRTDRLPQWDFLKLDPGSSWRAWLAGPMVSVNVHHRGGSRPCRKEMTKGKLPCPDCKDELPTVWRGYLPLWDENGGRWLSIIGIRYADIAMSLRFLDYVWVRKMETRGCPVRVESAMSKAPAVPAAIRDRQPADIRPFLLRIWKDKVLADWLDAHAEKKEPADVLDESVSMGSALRREVIDHLKDKRGPALLSDVLPQLNGKHKKGE